MNNLKIAYRFLTSNKSQTILISLGISIGVAVQIFLGLLIQNLQADLINKTVGNSPQITISSNDNSTKTFSNYDEIVKTSKSVINNNDAVVMPSLDTPSLLNKNDISQSILVRGISLSEGDELYNLNNKLISGSLPNENNEVIIGKELSKKYSLNVNDSFTFLSPNRDEITVKVSGIADFKVKALNESWVLTSLENAQSFFNLKGEASSIEIKLPQEEIFNADVLSSNLNENLTSNVVSSNWKEDNEELLSALNAQGASSITIQVFIIASVVMGIAGVLAISVMQKSKQIGILKSMGIKDKAAALIFLYQGVILGVIGAILGSSIALILFKSFNAFVKTSEGTPIVSGALFPNFILISMIIAVFSALISSLVAAKKSLKLDPIDIIRNS
ncbi:MAG: ABC transporter permease [Clostridium sp.]